MTTPTVTLNLSATSGPQNAAMGTASATISNNGGASVLGGTLQLVLDLTNTDDGTNLGSPFSVTGSYAFTLPNTTSVGAHTLTLLYSGDSNFNSTNSAPVTFTVTSSSGGGGGTPPPTPSTGTQAQVRPICSITAGTTPTRTERENGALAAESYQVSGFSGLPSGSGYYDANSVAVLYGSIGGTMTRQALTIGLGDGGGIETLTGFNSATLWDSPPKLVITRWSDGTDSAAFLGY